MIDTAISILGVPVGSYTLSSLFPRLEELIEAPGCAYTYGVNAHALNLAYSNNDFFQVLQQADLIYADGASLLLGARLLGKRLPEKITTTDLWPKMCELAIKQGLKFYFLGGEPGLMERARVKATKQFPGLNIVGTHDGYTDIFSSKIVAAINAVQPDIIWVGMGDPLQGLWTTAIRHRLQARLIITCGGMFKIVSERLKRVSRSWQQRGFEWVYRLWQEPQTWRRYLLGLPVFGLRVLLQRLTSKPMPPLADLNSNP